MHGTEGIAHERTVLTGEGSELLGELLALGLVLGRLAGIEAHVLDDQDLAVAQRLGLGLGVLAHDIGGNLDVEVRELGELLGSRGDRVLGIDLALGAAQVGAHDDAGAGLRELGDHGQRGADAAVVGDGRAVERHVEIGADQDAASRDALGEQIIQ